MSHDWWKTIYSQKDTAIESLAVLMKRAPECKSKLLVCEACGHIFKEEKKITSAMNILQFNARYETI